MSLAVEYPQVDVSEGDFDGEENNEGSMVCTKIAKICQAYFICARCSIITTSTAQLFQKFVIITGCNSS